MPSIVSVNGAGPSASDPIVKGLPVSLVMGAESVDAAQSIAAGIDAGSGFPIVNSVTSGLYPSATTVQPAGVTGTWTAATRTLGITNAGTVESGMYIGVSLGATKAFARIEQVVSATQLKLDRDPFGGIDQVNIAYQIWWVYRTFVGAVGSAVTSSPLGKLNVLKFQAADALANLGTNAPGSSFYVRDIPTNVVTINGGAYQGQQISVSNPSFNFLPDWASKGGVATIQLFGADGITWWDGGVDERTWISIASRLESDRIKIAGAETGTKSAVLRCRSTIASSRFVDLVTVSVAYDASAPVVSASVTASGPN